MEVPKITPSNSMKHEGQTKFLLACVDVFKRVIPASRKRKMALFFLGLATLHVTLLCVGFLYVKTSLVKSYHKSFREILSFKNVHSDPSTKSTIRWDLFSSGTKTILLWNNPASVSYPKILDSKRCGKCDIISNREQVSKSDAVVLHYHNITTVAHLPPTSTRNINQVYVWMCRESPNTTKEIYHLDLSQLNNVVNWTMSHRSDSDVFFPYVEMLHRIHDENHMTVKRDEKPTPKYVDLYYNSIEEVISRKRFLAAWVVGNCGVTTGAKARMELANKMIAEGMQIHRFGKCFKNSDFPAYRSEEAHAKLIEYKFYLAFENTYRCRDYVTYKFWKNAIYSGSVPIVWGVAKSDLVRLAPQHSFIHVEDFQSLNDLVKYVEYLDSNDTAYREYFHWRERELRNIDDVAEIVETTEIGSDWMFSLSEAFGYCKLCRMLHAREREEIKRKTIQSLSDWWYGSENEECIATQ